MPLAARLSTPPSPLRAPPPCRRNRRLHAPDTYRIVHTYPHDPQAYTQGLIFVDGHLYESTGLYGQSSLRMVDLESGRVLQEQSVRTNTSPKA